MANKICQASSGSLELVVSIHLLGCFASRAFASETRSERLNIKQMQSLGYSSAKLAQGTSSELENEAEERARGRRCRSRARNKREQRPGKETERSREVRDRGRDEYSAAARNGGKQDGGGRGYRRERERDGWMRRQRRFQ